MGTSELHQRSKQMKEQHVQRHGPSDVAPMMIVAFDDATTFVGTITKGMMKALSEGVRMGDIVAASVTTLRQQHDNMPLRRMMLVVEGYLKEVDEDAPTPEHGDLAEQYATDPASGVTEALITNTWAYHEDQVIFETMSSRFHYDDGGILVWDKDEGPFGIDARGSEGHICDSGRQAMR